jgi:hypothetical protein
VRYAANPSTQSVRDAMTTGLIDMIATPKQGNRLPDGVAWVADNGCFGKGYPGDDAWYAWLASFTPEQITRCRFAVAPDVVGDAWESYLRSYPWLRAIRELGYPVAYVAQNGEEELPTPWDDFDALFIGGDTTWKLGPGARQLVAQAKELGKWVHMGRVNSERRLQYAQAIGCDSVDGTYIAFGPDRNLPKLLGWLRGVQGPLFTLGGAA